MQLVLDIEITKEIKSFNVTFVFFGADLACPNSCFSGIFIPTGSKIKKTINQLIKKTTPIDE